MMWTSDVTGATSPTEVSPELLKPLVDVVATMGKLGATSGDVPLAKPWNSLRGGLLTFRAGVREALSHRRGEAARLRQALKTTATEGPGVPAATPEATVSRWLKAVATVEAAWAKLKAEATGLKDACTVVAETGATAGATAGAAMGNLLEAISQEDKAHKKMRETTHLLSLALQPTEAATEVMAGHEERLAEAQAGLQAASKATEEKAAAVARAMTAEEWGQHAAVACELLGQLVVACDGAHRYYGHLQRRLKDIEAMVGPEATQGDAGSPKGLAEAVAVAEALWVASYRLAQEHLLEMLSVVQVLLNTGGTAEAADLAKRCQDATTALPGLLPPGLA